MEYDGRRLVGGLWAAAATLACLAAPHGPAGALVWVAAMALVGAAASLLRGSQRHTASDVAAWASIVLETLTVVSHTWGLPDGSGVFGVEPFSAVDIAALAAILLTGWTTSRTRSDPRFGCGTEARLAAVARAVRQELRCEPTAGNATTTQRLTERAQNLAPGIALCLLGGWAAIALNTRHVDLSALVAAVVFGAVLGNAGVIPAAAGPGMAFAGKKFLRCGVALFGFRLTLETFVSLGITPFIVTALAVGVTFVGTRFVARLLGVPSGLGLLVASGFSICGLSAIAATAGVAGDEVDEDDIGYAMALVTLCGTLSIFVLPLAGHALEFTGAVAGQWIGTSVHDVAQTVVTADAMASSLTLASSLGVRETALATKLTRVLLLAPIIAAYAATLRRRAGTGAVAAKKPPIVPLFIVCFAAAVLARSYLPMSLAVRGRITQAETVLLASALIALGAGINVKRLARLGIRPLILGAASWLLIAGGSAAGIRLLQ